jgi:hypothetical protein
MCRSAECRVFYCCAECHFPECRHANVVMLNVIMLCVVVPILDCSSLPQFLKMYGLLIFGHFNGVSGPRARNLKTDV